MDIVRIVLDLVGRVIRYVIRAVGRLLSTIPAGWLVIMGVLSLPIAILSVAVALVFFLLLGLLSLLAVLFYVLIWRPVFGTRVKQEKVIEAEYTVKSDEDQ